MLCDLAEGALLVLYSYILHYFFTQCISVLGLSLRRITYLMAPPVAACVGCTEQTVIVQMYSYKVTHYYYF